MGKAIGALVAQGVLDLKRMTEYLLKAESEEEPEHGEDEDTGMCQHGKLCIPCGGLSSNSDS